GEHDLLGARPHEGRHAGARRLDRLARRLAPAVDRGSVAEALAEVRKHRLHDLGCRSGGGRVVGVDLAPHARPPAPMVAIDTCWASRPAMPLSARESSLPGRAITPRRPSPPPPRPAGRLGTAP